MDTADGRASDPGHDNVPIPSDVEQHAYAVVEQSIERFKRRHEFDARLAELEALRVTLGRPPSFLSIREDASADGLERLAELRSELRRYVAEDDEVP